jgi:hypothetical protein
LTVLLDRPVLLLHPGPALENRYYQAIDR